MASFVYLDVGGVAIVDFSDDSAKWEGFMRHLGVKRRDFGRFESFWHRREAEMNVGRELQTLIPLINRGFGCTLPKSYDLLSDFVDRFTENRAIWPAVRKMRRKYGMGLLTNMYPHMLDGIRRRRLLPRVRWDAVVDSSVEGVKKPDAAVYRLAERRAGSRGKEVALVDNSERNVDAARKAGWKAFLYDPARPGESSAALLEWLDM